MVSACGLLDASFREPSMDYIDLIKATKLMCGATDAQKLVKRAMFNLLTVNQDDHSKNFAFLQDDNENWKLSPFYDIVYSPLPNGEHMTSFNGSGTTASRKTIELMARKAGYKNAQPLIDIIKEIREVTLGFKDIALKTKLDRRVISDITDHMELVWNEIQKEL
jgi:serine/threonine-protein kinase HipA